MSLKPDVSRLTPLKPQASSLKPESQFTSDGPQVREEWLKQGLLQILSADKSISIPGRGRVDSLNASVSTALVIFEVVRQRHHEK